ncbi:hypothetical protein FKM82_024929 [Ascaphus truei]
MLSCCNSVLSHATQTYFSPLINTHKFNPTLTLPSSHLRTFADYFKKEVESIHQNIPSVSSYPSVLPTLFLLSFTLFPLYQKRVSPSQLISFLTLICYISILLQTCNSYTMTQK